MATFTPAPAASPFARQGKKLIVPAPLPGQPAVLPPLCVKCGAPADGKPVDKTFYWHHPALYLAILAGVLIYAILAIVLRKSIKVRVPLCARHAKRRSTAVTLSWVLPLVGIADIFVLSRLNVDGGVIALICAAFLLTGLVIWAVVANPIRPVFIDATRGEFTGMCATFLEQFPAGLPPAPAVGQQVAPPPLR